MMNSEEILGEVLKAIPYSDQLIEIQESTFNDSVRFTWRGTRFRVDDSLNVESVANGCLHSCNASILLRQLLLLKEENAKLKKFEGVES